MFNFLFEGKIGEILAPVTGSNQLYLAIQHHKNSEVQSLIDSSSGYSLSQLSDGGVSAIHIACRYNNTFALDLILKQGVAVDLKDSIGNTPLHYASKYGHFEICKILISRGCPPVVKNANNQSPYDVTESHVIRQYLLPLQFQSERDPYQGQGLGQQHMQMQQSNSGYGYGNEISGGSYDPYNNQGIVQQQQQQYLSNMTMSVGIPSTVSYPLPQQQQQQMSPPSPLGTQQMPYNSFNNNQAPPPAFNSVSTASSSNNNNNSSFAYHQQSPPRNNVDNNQQQQPQQSIQIQTQNPIPLVTIQSTATTTTIPPPPSIVTTTGPMAGGETAQIGFLPVPPSPKNITSTSSSSNVANTVNQSTTNRVFMPDGFHSSASDPALQLKYGHVKAAVNIAPPPTGMPAMSGTGAVSGVTGGGSPYSMYNNNSVMPIPGGGTSGINNYSLAAQQQPMNTALAPIASRYVGYDAHTNQPVNVNAYHSNNFNNVTPTHASSGISSGGNSTNQSYPPTNPSAPPSVMSVAPPMPSSFPMMPSHSSSQTITNQPSQHQPPMISISAPPPFSQPPPVIVQTQQLVSQQQSVSVPPPTATAGVTVGSMSSGQPFQPLVKVFNPVTDSSAEVVSINATSNAIL